MSARITIAAVLVSLQAFVFALGGVGHSWPIALCGAYLLATLAVRVYGKPKPPRRTFDTQWILTIGVDVVVFSSLNFMQSGGVNYTPLFALPVLLASILGPLQLALATAASVTLILLGDAWWVSLQSTGDWAPRFLQSALSGSGFFVVALLANQLALRVSREEQRAKSGQAAASMQTQVNELVIESLTDGVLVIDAKGVVRAANPASRRLLAIRDAVTATPFKLGTERAWQPLIELTRRSFRLGTSLETDVSLEFGARNSRRLHVRTRLAMAPGERLAQAGDEVESLCVMFLVDLREMEARVRTEKMAAMGRMSAAVAHEIRNPLAAISQANALLEEDLSNPALLQLTAMVRQNAQRLAKIVDDILNISRVEVMSPAAHGTVLMLDDAVSRVATEWAEQSKALPVVRTVFQAVAVAVVFDPEHLRRVMVNLLDNALRYASSTGGAIEVSTTVTASRQARLAIWSDGKPLEESVQAHLFEPFFSSESRSSGLGLYICRELCARYGAQINYQRVRRGNMDGNEFFVLFSQSDGIIGTEPAALNKQQSIF